MKPWLLLAVMCGCSGVVGAEDPLGRETPTEGRESGVASPTGSPPTPSVTLRLDGGVATPTGEGGPSCGEQTVPIAPREPEVLLVLDQSASMTENEIWSFVREAVLEAIQGTEAGIKWGLSLYPLITSSQTACIPASLPTLQSPSNAPAIRNFAAIEPNVPAVAEGDGTPTDTAIAMAKDYLLALGTPNPKYIVLATDGEPSCAGDEKDSSNAQAAAIAAITAANQAGIPTFVIGASPADKLTNLSRLTALAEAGGMAKPHTPCPAGAKKSECSAPEFFGFYPATDKAELLAVFQSIVGTLNTCQIQLDTVPPNPDLVAVAITDAQGQRVAIYPSGAGADAAGAWTYTDGSHTGIQVSGQACQTIARGAGGKVDIWYGCTVPPIL
jgi:hypothetical protein